MPRARSAFDTVPLPRMVPAVNARVLRDVRDQIEEREVHLGPGVAVADDRCRCRSCAARRCTRPSRQASPSSSGVTANGENAVAGLDWKKPKLLASSSGTRLRSVMSLASISSLHVRARRRRRACPAACRRGRRRPRTRSRGPTPDRASAMSSRGAEQHAGAALVDQRIGAQRLRRLGAARLAHQDDVVQERRAVDPLVRARQRRVRARARRAAAPAPAPRSSASASARSCGSARAQSSSAACSVGAIALAGA